ncbi:MAG: SIS domain-containing protein [Arcobacteraceae bacterium]|nr:SIS domain-containing protein [Arcobacteraceae bacterium]
MDNFINSYKKELIQLIENIDNDKIKQIINLIDQTKGKIYIIGNGGSAATASHMVNDLGVGLTRRDIKNLNIESLSDNTAVCTAIANDTGYENIFYYQIKNKIARDDLLIAISCSGNSANIIKAVEYATNLSVPIIGITGFDGGKLKDLSDINFHIETKDGQYGLVEDLHMILNHIIYSYYISTKLENAVLSLDKKFPRK